MSSEGEHLKVLGEEVRKVFAGIGLLIWTMQATEKIVDLVMTFVFQGDQKLTLQEFERLEREKRSRTLGRLIKQMHDRADLHPSLATLLENFVEHRNQLTHRISDIPGWDLETEKGREVAWTFLSNLHNENMRVLAIFSGFIVAWENQHKLGIVKDFPKEVVEILPAIPIYAAMIDELVFAKPLDRSKPNASIRRRRRQR